MHTTTNTTLPSKNLQATNREKERKGEERRYETKIATTTTSFATDGGLRVSMERKLLSTDCFFLSDIRFHFPNKAGEGK